MKTALRRSTFSILLWIAASQEGVALAENRVQPAAPCVAGATTLCLNENRFRIAVQWKDFQGNTGVGQAVPLTSDTGYFWFFNSANVELVVKVLDGRGLNNHFWVFFGALSNVEYTMTVTDSVIGSVKTYFNPSGQFASIGDTSAFSANGSVSSAFALAEGSMASGPLGVHSSAVTQALSTCVALETSLCLNDGRFRVEVNWKDFQGNTGVGTAVSLTPDTGYFWFFNDANVELVVKVLDARALNQKFWVFYGALSNVEYEMTVTDTLTGNVSTYVNPSGRFASAGDTAAFPAGHAVTVRLDESRAVSADIPTNGGTISATASDGTVFTLAIPEDALLSEERITMTPVASIEGLPLSRGLAAAVDLKPTGLRLYELATLKIAPPLPIPVAEEITFAWRGGGQEFFLYPPGLGTSEISMKIMHFSGYGVGRGSAADEMAQRQRIPASPEDALSQRLQEAVAAIRRSQSGGVVAFADLTSGALLLEFYNSVLRHELNIAKKKCTYFKTIEQRAWAWAKQAVLYDCCRTEVFLVEEAIIDGLANCYLEAFDKCKASCCPQSSDPSQIPVMLGIREKLRKLGSVDRANPAHLSVCARFELDFDSVMYTQPSLFTWRVRAKVPIRFQNPVDATGPLTGSASLEAFEVEYVGTPLAAPCSETIAKRSGVFKVEKLEINFNAYEGGASPPDPVTMVYDPGRPGHSWTVSCPNIPSSTTQWEWTDLYGFTLMQLGEPRGAQFIAKGWQLIGRGLYARKRYDVQATGAQQPYGQTTIMRLFHTPGAL